MEVKRKTLNHNVNSNRKYQYTGIPTTDSDTALDAKQRSASIFNGASSVPSTSSEATELTSLRPRSSANNLQSYNTDQHRVKPPDDVVYLDREILPTDTLQSFALLYGCTLNDLKRANNLVTDQDFYARRYVKIPVKRHGLLTDQAEETKRRTANVATTSLGGTPLKKAPNPSGEGFAADDAMHSDVYRANDSEVSSTETLNLLAGNPTTSFKQLAVDKNDASKYLKKVDKEIRKTVRKNDELQSDRNEVLEEVVSSLGSVGYRPLPPPGSGTSDDCDGADWGFKWWVLLFCFIFIIIIIVAVGIELYLNHQYLMTITNGGSTSPKQGLH